MKKTRSISFFTENSELRVSKDDEDDDRITLVIFPVIDIGQPAQCLTVTKFELALLCDDIDKFIDEVEAN